MPIYEYRCQDCGKTIEKILHQAVTEIPCPACGGNARRVVSIFASAGAADVGGTCGAPGGSPFS